jgi:hypothetical protein
MTARKAIAVLGVDDDPFTPDDEQIIKLIEFVKGKAIKYFGDVPVREVDYGGIDTEDERRVLFFTVGISGTRQQLEAVAGLNTIFSINWVEFDEANAQEAAEKGVDLHQ